MVAPETQQIKIILDAGVGSDWLKTWGPTFIDRLNLQTQGRMNLTFGLSRYVASEMPLDDLVSRREIHFYFCQPPSCACAQARYGATPLATIRKYVPGPLVSSSVFGGVIVAAMNNSRIRSLSDLNRSKIGMENAGAWGTGLMEMRAMFTAGLHLYRDASLVAVGNLQRAFSQSTILDLVESGQLDAGFVRSDVLAASGRSASFRVVGPRSASGLDFAADAYPLPSSTELSPDWAFMAFPSTDPAVKAAALFALLQIQPADDAAVLGGYAGWEPARSYEQIESALDDFGLIATNASTGRRQCIWNARGFQYYDLVTCPAGFAKAPAALAERNCRVLGLACPAPTCWCGPCVLAARAAVTVSLVGPNGTEPPAAAACRKMEVCLVVQQRRAFRAVVADSQLRTGLNVTFEIIDLGVGPSTASAGRLVSSPGLPWQYCANATLNETGIFLFQVSVDGDVVDSSPTLVQIVAAVCEDGSNRRADAQGVCVCEPSDVEVGAACVPAVTIYCAVLFPCFAAALVATCLAASRRLDANDSAWRVSISELTFDQPPVVIGVSLLGVVFRAELRGTNVAVKRISYSRALAYSKACQEPVKFSQSYPLLRLRGKSTGILFNADEPGPSVLRHAADPATEISSIFETSNYHTFCKSPLCLLLRGKQESLFCREMRSLSKLRHPNIAAVMAVVRRNDTLLIMEFMV